MPHDPVTVAETVLPKDVSGAHDLILQARHEAPATDSGAVAYDPYQKMNAEIAATMMRWLQKHYPGHPWGCISDVRQGIVKFNIPILMGMQNWWVVNLGTHDIVDGMRQGAGQILERYRLRRGRFNLTQFLEARAAHSALVLPSRKVPE